MSDAGARQRCSSKQRALADPHAELPVKNFKYVKSCTELYLSQRGIEELAHFDAFVNLEVLWLNGNSIKKLEGLDQCFRIKELYAHNNRIRSLESSSLAAFTFLHTLRLNDNKLQDFSTTLRVLAKLRHLHDLDLYGNALEEEDNYRLHVIRVVPSLRILDRRVVTDDERAQAARLRSEPGSSTHHQKQRTTKYEVVAGAPPQSMSGTVKMLFKEIDKIHLENAAAEKAATERQLQLVDQQQQQQQIKQMIGSFSRASAGASSSSVGGLDAWELASLEKHFRSLEDNIKSGVSLEKLNQLASYLADRGFLLACGGEDVVDTATIAPPPPLVIADQLLAVFPERRLTWQQLRQSLEKGQLHCDGMHTKQLKVRADLYFAQAATLQKRLLTASDTGRDDTRAKLTRAAHEAVQRALHLDAMADGKSAPVRADTKQNPAADALALAPPRTRYYMTSFVREEAETAKFHALQDQSEQLRAGLGAKYKLHQKDFQKYLVKQAPPATSLVRRQFHQ